MIAASVVLLSGQTFSSSGSAYGEEAITAVATCLKDLGFRAGNW